MVEQPWGGVLGHPWGSSCRSVIAARGTPKNAYRDADEYVLLYVEQRIVDTPAIIRFHFRVDESNLHSCSMELIVDGVENADECFITYEKITNDLKSIYGEPVVEERKHCCVGKEATASEVVFGNASVFTGWEFPKLIIYQNMKQQFGFGPTLVVSLMDPEYRSLKQAQEECWYRLTSQ